MTEREPASYTVEEIADPTIDAATLREITVARPDLWNAVLAHPNCYPELADFIRQQQSAAPAAVQPPQQDPAPVQPAASQDPAAAQPVAPQAAYAPPAQQPIAQQPPQQPYAQPAPGQPVPGQPQQNPGSEAFAAGAQQVAEGAKDFFASASQSFQSAVNEGKAAAPGLAKWTIWAQLALPVLALLGIICLFLPAVTISLFGFSQSTNYFGAGTAAFPLILFLAVIAFTVVALALHKKWAQITAAGVGILAALIGLYMGFGVTVAAGSAGYGASPGVGAVLLGIFSLVLLAAAVVVLIPVLKSAGTTPPAPPAPPAPPVQ